MRIIIANDYMRTAGGAGKCALLEAVELANAGFDCTYLAYTGEINQEYAKAAPSLKWFAFGHPEEPPTSKRTAKYAWNQEVYDKTRAFIQQGNPAETILHLHLWRDYLSGAVVTAAQDAGAHVIIGLHDYTTACPQGQFYNAKAKALCTLKPGGAACVATQCMSSRSYMGKATTLYRWWVQGKRGLPSTVRHFQMFSHKSTGILRPYLPSETSLHLMRYPIQVERHPRVEAEKNQDFVFTGRISPEKNPMLLLRAAEKLGVKARFVGDGPMRKDVESAGYAGASVSGWVDNQGVMAELSRARCYVLPSIWYEVQPLAPVEALGRGIPCLVSDATASVETVADGETGYHFRSKDVDMLAERMAKMLDDAHVRQMSDAAYDRFWADPPTPKSHMDSCLAAYEKILGRAVA